MSRYYAMDFIVESFDPTKEDAIKKVIADIWDCDDICVRNDRVLQIHAHGTDYLCGGCDEDDFCAEAVPKIWEANGKPCVVEVTATWLDDLPCEIHLFDPNDPDTLKMLNWKEDD